MGHRVTAVREEGPDYWTIEYFDDTDTDRVRGYGVSIPREAVANRMAAYAIEDPAEALSVCIHECHWRGIKPEPRDDPALVQGWVTSTDPDAERIHLYTALSTPDAAGAHKARMDACRAAMRLADPDGLLPSHTPSPVDVRRHRELTDIARWRHIYGGLPVEPARSPMEAIHA